MNQSSNIRRKAVAIMLAVFMLPLAAKADIDKKFYKKAAETVWNMDLPQFNPKADLSDSIFQNQSGVFIARYISLDAKYNNEIDPSKMSTVGLSNSNSTKAVYMRRSMVKLNDASAVEEYTEFSVNPAIKEDVRGYVVLEIKPAFGARIIKPDGSVQDVDMQEALTVTSGKKKKDSEYKIAIPGLEPGDILDYFYYTEYFFDELSIPSFTVSFLTAYPTKNFMLDCRTDPELAFEYGSYNGAPKLTTFNTVGKQNQLFVEIENIEALDEKMPYFSVARQMPFMDIHVLNNQARMLQFVPNTARPGGMRHAAYPFLMADIATSITDCKFNQKIINSATSIVKDWKKAHPEANDRQIVDAAWIALRFAISKEEEATSDRQMAIMFTKVLDKIDSPLSGRVGVTSSRGNVPVTDLVHFSDADFVVFVGDTCYIPSNNVTMLPGELPEKYDGEKYVVFDAKADNPNLKNAARPGALPRSKANNNVGRLITSITLDPDNDEHLIATTDCYFTGAVKVTGKSLVSDVECLKHIAGFLGQKPLKPRKDYDIEAEQENIRDGSKDLAGLLWSTDNPEIKDFRVVQPGCIPDSADMHLYFKGVVPDAITQAGNNIMVNIGKFIAKQEQIKGKNREREISIVRNCPEKYDVTINFEIPEGYELVEGSIDDLNRSIVTPEATFNSEAHVNGRTVTVRIVERYPRSIYPAESWPSLLKVLDGSYEFNSASIILRPV